MNDLESILKQISKLDSGVQQIELAAVVAGEFQKENVTMTVVGGAAVQFYTNAEYTTKDIDAILYNDSLEIVERVMSRLGFERTTTYRHFEHPLFKFVVEFPPEPIEVGGRQISNVVELVMGSKKVRVIRIEDLIMDRIIAGVEWKSSGHIAQARLLWIKNKKQIDKAYLRKFAAEEGYAKELKNVMGTPIIGTKAPAKKRKN